MLTKMTLESAFKNYLTQVVGGKDLDDLPEYVFPKNKADFYLEKNKSIFEIKSISSDRTDSFGPWIQKKIETNSEWKNGMPRVFGSVPFERIYEAHSNKDLLNKQLDSLASKTLSDYVRSAKHQIFDTKKALNCEDALGFLVILNEGYEFYET